MTIRKTYGYDPRRHCVTSEPIAYRVPQWERASGPVHVWTTDEIKALPGFGFDNGWFYGLVATAALDQDIVVLAEVYPGTGYTLVDTGDIANGDVDWDVVLADLRRHSPTKTPEQESGDA